MKSSSLKIICTCFAIISIILGISTLLDLENRTSAGYRLGDAHNIIEIFEGTAAENAGLQVGDQIISIGGIAIENTKARDAAPRTVIGETKNFIIERDGQEISLPLTYDGLSTSSKRHWYLGFVSGIITCGISLWLLYKFSSLPAILAGLFLLCFGSLNFGHPYFSNSTVELFHNLIMYFLSSFVFAFLVDFLLYYPQLKEFRKRTFSKWLIYLPAFLMFIIGAWDEITRPNLTEELNTFWRILVVSFHLFYIGWIFLLMIQSFRKYTASERSSFGLNWIYIGLLVGFLPLLFLIFLIAFFPEGPALRFMGDVIPIAFTAIPVFLLLAIQKWEQKDRVALAV